MSESKHAVIRTHWEGPLPPPETLEAFHRADPNAVKTILELAKQEQHNQHQLDMADIQAVHDDMMRQHESIKRGQYIAALAIVVVCCTSCLVSIFADWRGGAAIAAVGLAKIVCQLIGRNIKK